MTIRAITIVTISTAILFSLTFVLPWPGSPVVYPAEGIVEVDIATMSPSDDVEQARAVFNCDLGGEVCDVMLDHLVDLPFGWHETGYDMYFSDRETVRDTCTTSVASRGCVRTSKKEIHVAVGFAEEFGSAEFRLWNELYPVLRTFTHEVGHLLHASCGPLGIEEAKLSSYARTRGLPEGIDMRGHAEGPYTSKAEDFAETAMLWLTGEHPLTFYSRSPYGEPDPEALTALAEKYFGMCR